MAKTSLRASMVLLGMLFCPAILGAGPAGQGLPAAAPCLWARAGTPLTFAFPSHEQAFHAVRLNGAPVAFQWIAGTADPVQYQLAVPLDSALGMGELAADTAYGVTRCVPILILPAP